MIFVLLAVWLFQAWRIVFMKSPGNYMLHYNKHKLVHRRKQHFSLQAVQVRLFCLIPMSVMGLPFLPPAIQASLPASLD